MSYFGRCAENLSPRTSAVNERSGRGRLKCDGRARGPARAVRQRNCWDYQSPPALQPPLLAVAQERLSVPVVLSRVIVNVLPDFEYAVIA